MKQSINYNAYFLKKQQLLETMANELPEHFEVVVIGTGLEESILAGAIARAGHSVLHLDPNDFYGGEWASFNFDGLQSWIKSMKEEKTSTKGKLEDETHLKEGEEFIALRQNCSRFSEFQETFYEEALAERSNQSSEEISPLDDDDASDHSTVSTKCKPWNKERILSESRKFNIDLIPKLLYTSGSLVELLISSNVSRYLEFKALNRVLTTTPDGESLDHVPSSRADVFSTKKISVVEKRILMKFLTFAHNYEAHPEVFEDYKTKNFLSFLKKEKLTPNLIHFLLNSIALVGPDSSTMEGLTSTKKFLSSLGRFGSNTPYLWTVFGGGELPQAFCRLCAVFGGTYYLNQSVEGILRDSEGRVSGVMLNGGSKRVSCDYVIANEDFLPSDLKNETDGIDMIYRNISIVKDSVLPSDTEKISMISVPLQLPSGSYSFAFLQEVGHGAAICPKGLYLRHTSSKIPYEPFKFESQSSPLWNLSFCVRGRGLSPGICSPTVHNLYYTSGPAFELDYEENINHAKKLFHALYPEEEFLPRAPDPEEIIIGEGVSQDELATNEPASKFEDLPHSEEASKSDEIRHSEDASSS